MSRLGIRNPLDKADAVCDGRSRVFSVCYRCRPSRLEAETNEANG